MDYEKKYKEALEWMREIYPTMTGCDKEDAEHYFPELKENKDEQIRKHLIRHFQNKTKQEWNGMPIKDILTWLERHDEQKPKKISLWKHWKDGIAGNGEGETIYLVKMDNTYRLTSCLGFECDYIELSELDSLIYEKQGEKKPVPDWKPIDAEYMNKLCEIIDEYDVKTTTKCCWKRWLKSLKDRVLPQNIAYYNPYKEVVESIVEMCKHYDKASHSGLRDFYDNVKVKCKDAKEYDSLFPQNTWKPSDEQMEALCDINLTGGISYAGQGQELINLYNDLKKIKEE